MKLKNKLTLGLILTAVTSLLTSCSVIMAAKKEGTSLEQIQCARTRGQILSNAATVISSERQASGELIEVYQFKKEKGSAARALMHGALDVSTCGLWEVIGTPVEACLDEDKFYVMKVFYDAYDNITKIELL